MKAATASQPQIVKCKNEKKNLNNKGNAKLNVGLFIIAPNKIKV